MTGIVGALSTLPISLWTVYVILTLGGPKYLSGGEIETRGTHLFYSATGRVAALLPSEHLIIPLLILYAGIQALLLWLIVRDFLRSGETQKAFLPWLLKVLGIVLVLLLFSRVIGFPFRIVVELWGERGLASLLIIKESQWLTWLLMTGALAASFAPVGFIAWATFHAAASSSPANRFRPFLVPIVAYFLALAGLAALPQVLTTRLDLGKTLKGIPGLTSESRAVPGVLVVSRPAGSYSLPGYYGSGDLRGKAVIDLPADAVVPFTERNAQLIRERLAHRNYWTFLSADAWLYLAEERWRALDPDSAVRIHTEAFERDGWLLHWITLLGALRTMAPRPEFLAIVDRLSDENRYHVGARGAAYVSLAYAGQGAAERAAFWRQRAIASLPPDDYMRKRLDRSILRMPTPLAGSVRGRLLLDDQPASGLRVGLGLANERIREALKKGIRMTVLSRFLVSGGPVAADGRFELKGLPPGDYVLLVAWDSEASAFPLRSDTSLPQVSLTPGRPVVDVGTIRLARGRK